MKTLIYTVGYSSDFRKSCNTGWGCGYILIPLDHKFLQVNKDEMESDDDNYSWGQMQIPYFSEEITLDEIKEVNGEKYRLLGFDTAHSWNNDAHNYDWVLDKTLAMQRMVEEYNL